MSTVITPSRPETSSPAAFVWARARKRFEVRLASRTGCPTGIASYEAFARATASACVAHPTRSVTATTYRCPSVARYSGLSSWKQRLARIPSAYRGTRRVVRRSTTDTGGPMATGETGFDDVTYDLISLQYHALKAGHDYGQYVRDAENADQKEIAEFFRNVMEEDSQRAHKCHEFLRKLGGTDNTSPQG